MKTWDKDQELEPDCTEEQRREIEQYIEDIPDPQTR